jgi:diacylglycerol O-acyltransferase / wax synthase
MLQLSGQDASFVYFETPATPMHIGSVAIYDPSTAPGGAVRFKDILRFVESRLGAARSFRQKLVRVPFDLDHPYWIEDADFDLEYHIRHIALPKPGDWRQLCIQVARLHARPLDMTKPLWEFWIVEGLDNIPAVPPGSFALVSKVHHAAIDGMSGVEMSSAVHDLDANMTPRAVADNWRPETPPGIGEMAIRTYISSIRQPFKLASTVWNSIPGVTKLGKQISSGDVSIANTKLAPQTRFNRKVSPQRVFDGATFTLAEVRAVKEAVPGATVNDVILAIIGGGLRRYLLDKNELPKENMTAMAPISVRAEGEKGALGNLVSAMVVSLGTTIADPLERFEHIHKEALNSKAMTNAVGARTLADYSQLIPAGLSGLGARLYTRLGIANAHAPVYNLIATNVPGPRVPLYFTGAKLVKMLGLGPVFDSMGMINTIYSYLDEIVISFTSDRKMMPDPAFYAECLRAAFEDMKAAIAAKASAPAPKPKSPPKPRTKPTAKPVPRAAATKARTASPKPKTLKGTP